ncbi:MAG: TRAP transporter large permease subunit [Marinobacter sp.]|nr:TRAP transporter large permease subunit [Marinobacter sp.]
MEGSIIGFLSLAVVLGLITVGIPVAISILSVAVLGMYVLLGDSFLFTTFETTVWAMSTKYSFAIIPMFILMGEFAGGARIITDLYNACYRWIGGIRGRGLQFDSACIGWFLRPYRVQPLSTRQSLRAWPYPRLTDWGYHRGFGAGCIAASGTLAALIPPSLTMVLFGFLTDQSIGALLIAGILPGILTAIMLMVTVWTSVFVRPELAPANVDRFSLREKNFEPVGHLAGRASCRYRAFGDLHREGIAFGRRHGRRHGGPDYRVDQTADDLDDILGARSGGRQLSRPRFFLIIIAGLLFSRMLLFSGAVSDLTSFMTASGFTPFTFMACVVIGFFIFGMFIDPVTMMVVSIPFLFPVVLEMGVDPIWFGIIIVKLIEIAAITPRSGSTCSP